MQSIFVVAHNHVNKTHKTAMHCTLFLLFFVIAKKHPFFVHHLLLFQLAINKDERGSNDIPCFSIQFFFIEKHLLIIAFFVHLFINAIGFTEFLYKTILSDS